MRPICLMAAIGLLPLLQPAWAVPDSLPHDAAPSAQAQHGGGGFALLLLDYRLALERLTEQLRARGAELMDGAALFPGEMMGAWERVTKGAGPLALIAGLLAILGVALLARHAVRRRLAGAPVAGTRLFAARPSGVESQFEARFQPAIIGAKPAAGGQHERQD